MTFNLIFLITIAAIVIIGFIFLIANRNYKKGFNDAKEKFNVIPDIVWDHQNIVHRGICPTLGTEIYEKEHPCLNDEKDAIPKFGINIKYTNDDENPIKRHFTIESCCDYHIPYKTKTIITPNGVSDGYHTFDELYQYRLMYNAGLVNMIAYTKFRYHDFHNPLDKITVYKSKKHNDGHKCFDGNWFIVVIETPWGQISNHYELKDWDKFNCKIIRKSHKYDGHTPQDCLERLNKLYSYLIEKANKF